MIMIMGEPAIGEESPRSALLGSKPANARCHPAQRRIPVVHGPSPAAACALGVPPSDSTLRRRHTDAPPHLSTGPTSCIVAERGAIVPRHQAVPPIMETWGNVLPGPAGDRTHDPWMNAALAPSAWTTSRATRDGFSPPRSRAHRGRCCRPRPVCCAPDISIGRYCVRIVRYHRRSARQEGRNPVESNRRIIPDERNGTISAPFGHPLRQEPFSWSSSRHRRTPLTRPPGAKVGCRHRAVMEISRAPFPG